MNKSFLYNAELIMKILFISVVYFVSAKAVSPLSLVESGSVFAIWPPTGIALMFLYLFGYRIWPGIFIGALAINMTLTPFLPSAQIAVTNTLGPLFAFWFLQKYDALNIFNTKKAMFLFFLSICLASLITASGGCISLWVFGYISEITVLNVWTGWFLGDLIGFLLISTIVESVRSKPNSVKRLFSVEGSLIISTFIIINLVIFGPLTIFNLIEYPVVYFLLPPLIWITLRLGQELAVISLLIVAIASIYGTIIGYGPFLRDDPNQSLLLLQSFNGTLAITILLIAAIFHESERAQMELNEHKDNLVRQVQDGIEKCRKKDQYMLAQSRLAQMGEMISMIAHQWRQPLSSISSTSIHLKMQSELERFDLEQKEEAKKYESYINNGLNSIDELVQNLTTTIDDFRNFYKPNKKPVIVNLGDVIDKAINILKPSLINHNVNVIKEYNSDEDIEVYNGEVMQVVLNLLHNAQENFEEKQIKNRTIIIKTENRTITVCDNGKGIPEDIIEKIFDPYFSTKDKKNGTGLGLYMSKIIIEKHHTGSLIAKNTDDGVCFTIEFGKISEKDKP